MDRPISPPAGVSLFEWVKRELRGAITRGDFSPDQPFVTQREIVERYGVSTTTAVRALNELVADGLVVRRRGKGTFVAERSAPAATDARLLTFINPGPCGWHETEMLGGLVTASGALGYRLAIERSETVAHEEELLRRAADGGSAGVVLYPRDGSVAADGVERLRRAGVAVVLVDRYLPGLPTDAVIFDDFLVGYDVTSAMLDRGHRAPGVLWSETEVTSVRDRQAGHYRALRERGLPELPERTALRVYDQLEPAARRARLRAMLDSAEPLTALICGNAPTLELVVSDLLEMEAGFPGTLELAAMDQSTPHGVSPLAVASARLPTRELGERAARLIHRRISGDTGPIRHEVLRATVQVAERGPNTLGVIGAAVRA
ncbi:LacI family DNA-binding transcriptional regulator [Pseudonocardia eucalypti]|uniref:LacI family DNA-binding transcriptional regulator n=1 Tax=Pseudonocardia eucalypti TaxID=648755 RepID=A0ABP9PVN6_9PSEU|nr:DNA-binding LacI/PurR family transcriptional regulator [Pseudonocardia eucalypti]